MLESSDPKIVIHGNECIILFLTLSYVPEHTKLPISPLSLGTVFSDLALWRHYSCFATSRERGLLALWRHIRRLFLHAQIGAKAIFTSE